MLGIVRWPWSVAHAFLLMGGYQLEESVEPAWRLVDSLGGVTDVGPPVREGIERKPLDSDFV